MKLVIFTCLLLSVNASLSTIRSGPRKQVNEDYEFGRPAIDLVDVEKAFQEMQFAHIRALVGDGSLGLAMSTLMGSGSMTIQPGMGSSSMTIQPAMGSMTIQPAMGSMTIQPASSMATTLPPVPTSSPSTITKSSECVPPDLSNSPSINIAFKLEVETRSGETTLVDDLAAVMVSSLASSFSLCVPSESRFLTGRVLQDSAVIWLLASDRSGISDVSCTATTSDASCEVLDVVLTVFSTDEASTEEAGQEVYDEVLEQLEDGEILKKSWNNDAIVAVRLQQNDGTVDNGVEAGDGDADKDRSGGAWNDAARKATYSLLSLLAVSVVAVGVYRKVSSREDDSSSDGSIGASCDSSIVTGDHTAHQTILTEDSQNPA